jgi:Mn2+/Fe2+ NRAMP family transporter
VKRTTAVAGAMFLMAMSAAGPGFITQTATFTNTYGASFATAIVASIVIDIAIQLNVWRVIGISGLRAQDLANKVIPWAGHVLTVLIVAGGLVFSIGNIAGAGLGLHNLLGLDPRIGATLSAALAILIFSYKGLEGTVDKAVIALGAVKIGLIAFVAVTTTPPVGEAIVRTFSPQGLDFLPVLTLIGGTVGGYITYAGIHRMVESGIVGPATSRPSPGDRSTASWSPGSCGSCCSSASWASSRAGSRSHGPTRPAPPSSPPESWACGSSV